LCGTLAPSFSGEALNPISEHGLTGTCEAGEEHGYEGEILSEHV
jgi:hypothetical protein